MLPGIAAGHIPDEFLYGFREVQRRFPSATLIEPTAQRTLLQRVLAPFERLTPRLGFPLYVSTALENLRLIRSARALVGTTDGTGIPLLLLRRLGLHGTPVILITQGLHSIGEDTRTLPWSRPLVRFLGGCLARAAAIVTFGDGDTSALRRTFDFVRLPEVAQIQFGIDADFWHPASAPVGDYALSVGSDHLRDYPTLLAAIDAIPLRIVTRLPLPPELLRASVTVQSKLEWSELRALYQQARFVVTPVKDQPRDSGHSATLQAMACGKAVILSDTQGLWDREHMRHRETCWLVPPGDPAAMRAAITHFHSHPDEAARIGQNARQLVEKRYTSQSFGTSLTALIEHVHT
jgi:glycosyltransferase involved in cell wall biosynthesis